MNIYACYVYYSGHSALSIITIATNQMSLQTACQAPPVVSLASLTCVGARSLASYSFAPFPSSLLSS